MCQQMALRPLQSQARSLPPILYQSVYLMPVFLVERKPSAITSCPAIRYPRSPRAWRQQSMETPISLQLVSQPLPFQAWSILHQLLRMPPHTARPPIMAQPNRWFWVERWLAQYACNNLNELVGISAGGAMRFHGTTNKAIKSSTIATQVISLTATAPSQTTLFIFNQFRSNRDLDAECPNKWQCDHHSRWHKNHRRCVDHRGAEIAT